MVTILVMLEFGNNHDLSFSTNTKPLKHIKALE